MIAYEYSLNHPETQEWLIVLIGIFSTLLYDRSVTVSTRSGHYTSISDRSVTVSTSKKCSLHLHI